MDAENTAMEAEEAPEATEVEERTDSETAQRDEQYFDAERAKAKIAKANSEAKSLRERLRAAEKRLAELDNANKTDEERAQERFKSLETRAAEAERLAMRYEVALEKGLSVKQAKRLVGDTIEELMADADDLIETFGAITETTKKPPSKKPTEALKGGGNPEKEPELSGDQAADLITKKIRGY